MRPKTFRRLTSTLTKCFTKMSKALRSENDQDISHIYGMETDFYNVMSIVRGKFWELRG